MKSGSPPPITESAEALEQLHLAVQPVGHSGQVAYALDCAASNFYDAALGEYVPAGKRWSKEKLMSFYAALASDWDVVSF